jgi:hypothetical protein
MWAAKKIVTVIIRRIQIRRHQSHQPNPRHARRAGLATELLLIYHSQWGGIIPLSREDEYPAACPLSTYKKMRKAGLAARFLGGSPHEASPLDFVL